jgi:hypothetical protein
MEYLFQKFSLQASLAKQPEVIQEQVARLGEDYVLGASEDDLVAALAQEFLWNPPVLGDPVIANDNEVNVERRSDWHGVARTYNVKEMQVVIHIPFTGDAEFFQMQPDRIHTTAPKATVRQLAVEQSCLEIIFQGRDPMGDSIREGVKTLLAEIHFHLDQIHEAAVRHNAVMPDQIRAEIKNRKQRILARRQMVSSIGFPMRKRADAPTTYAVSGIRKKPEIRMPVVSEPTFVPEPALAEAEYENILSIMRSMVRVVENSPHHFADLEEEAIRSHFLVQLNGQYHGRATGETFNYQGKTDILIREHDRNVFIAECKIWKGKDSLTKAIDQILGYLHWRDTKAAILLFNRNRDFTNVLAQIAPIVQAHSCFKRLIRHAGETEWRFVFCNKDDRNRELYLAILAFDIPQTQESNRQNE